MSALEKAEQAAQQASAQSDALAVAIAKALAAQAAQQPVQAPARPSIQISGPAVVGGVMAVAVVGTVLTSLLMALAICACSTAVCALVIRSILNGQQKRH